MFHFTCAFAGARYVVVFLIRSCGYTRIEQRNDAACPRSGADHWTCPGARPTPSWPPLVGRPCGRLEEANCIGRPISSAPARTQKTLSERREFPNGVSPRGCQQRRPPARPWLRHSGRDKQGGHLSAFFARGGAFLSNDTPDSGSCWNPTGGGLTAGLAAFASTPMPGGSALTNGCLGSEGKLETISGYN